MHKVIIHEVGLRDGLQMESEPVPTITKEHWIDQLIEAGVDIIQLGSFVNPGKVPQMADTDDLFEIYNSPGKKQGNTLFSCLVLNEKGLERAMLCGAEMICMGFSASQTHSLKNTGMATEEAAARIINMAKRAIDAGKTVQASIQSAFGCGFEGDIEEDRVIGYAGQYIDAGVRQISLADTAGYANPLKVERMFSAIKKIDSTAGLACHFHNTYGMGLANCLAAMNTGVEYFETAFGGLGGCPFTNLPTGNVCTEDFVNMLQEMGLRTEINNDNIAGIAKYACGFFIKDVPGHLYKIGKIKH